MRIGRPSPKCHVNEMRNLTSFGPEKSQFQSDLALYTNLALVDRFHRNCCYNQKVSTWFLILLLLEWVHGKSGT